jgi:GntR family transcriptional repressor for pyruvate dehydrogenase complex
MVKPISKISITDQCVAGIKEDILSGNYAINDKLPSEKELCENLQVGRSTVREALRMLQAMGYIKIIHGKGAFVAKISENESVASAEKWFASKSYELSDIMNVRLALEQMAIKHAVGNITEDEIQSMREIHKEFISAAVEGQVVKMVLYDELFHNVFVKASRNPLLILLNQQISEALRDYRTNIFSVSGYRFSAVEPHQNIIDSLAKRDEEKAMAAVANHINYIIKDIDGILTSE